MTTPFSHTAKRDLTDGKLRWTIKQKRNSTILNGLIKKMERGRFLIEQDNLVADWMIE